MQKYHKTQKCLLNSIRCKNNVAISFSSPEVQFMQMQAFTFITPIRIISPFPEDTGLLFKMLQLDLSRAVLKINYMFCANVCRN